jgi:hypothetical protein
MRQQLLAQHRQNLLVEQAVDVARPGIRQQAGAVSASYRLSSIVRGQAVVTAQALAHLVQLHSTMVRMAACASGR